MGKLASVPYWTVKPDPKPDHVPGDVEWLFLRIRPNGMKTWVTEYELQRSLAVMSNTQA